MKLELWTLGDTRLDFVQEGSQRYEKRLRNFYPFEHKIIPYAKNTKNLSEAEQKTKEGEAVLKRLESQDVLILFDERGQSLSSLGLADWLQQQFNQSPRRLVFLIGGAYGFSPELYQRAQAKLSLSKMTFSHQLVRLLVMEQLYRAAAILHHHPYHHE